MKMFWLQLSISGNLWLFFNVSVAAFVNVYGTDMKRLQKGSGGNYDLYKKSV